MLIKEYRIPLPLSVEEYRVAQLYMIAKKSRQESSGRGSGVEIFVNEPYDDGPGGSGQYTRKLYHVGSHLPGWIKALVPKTLIVEEEAWNAYPYTKTRYTCPFVEKFSIEIETKYFDDSGQQENVFGLTGSELRNRVTDVIDIVCDQVSAGDYVESEDPSLYVSEKTGRGPLTEDWIEKHLKSNSIMTAYKLCRVEFRYWGMQTKIERFIDDVALRKINLRAHRQAWAWQDEWLGLTIEDVRLIEAETQAELARKMAENSETDEQGDHDSAGHGTSGGSVDMKAIDVDSNQPVEVQSLQKQHKHQAVTHKTSTDGNKRKRGSRHAIQSPVDQVAWRMEGLECASDSDSEDQFFDAEDYEEAGMSAQPPPDLHGPLTKWSSVEMVQHAGGDVPLDESIFAPSHVRRTQERAHHTHLDTSTSGHSSPAASPGHQQASSCPTSVLILVVHGGNILDHGLEQTQPKTTDMATFTGTLELIIRQHYPALVGHIATKLVSCPAICAESLAVLSNLSPFGFQSSPSFDGTTNKQDPLPIAALPLFAISTPEYEESLSNTVAIINGCYQEFLKSPEGLGFTGQVVLIGDSLGAILAFDAICRTSSHLGVGSHFGSDSSLQESKSNPLISISNESATDIPAASNTGCSSTGTTGSSSADETKKPTGSLPLTVGQEEETSQGSFFDASSFQKLLSAQVSTSGRRRRSNSGGPDSKLDFEPSDLFMCGSPIALILSYRKMVTGDDKTAPLPKPGNTQVYNLFHPTDPLGLRIEPLISAKFSQLPPVNVPRFQKYPLGDGQPIHFLNSRWWGNKRIDYALYCPEGLVNFPSTSLPHLFHSSYWESQDVASFVLRQLVRCDSVQQCLDSDTPTPSFVPGQPREKWIKKRTSVKIKNVTANHRANDIIVKEGAPQVLTARFVYGPLDMVALTGEKVDVHIMKDIRLGDWTLLSTENTDKTGRVNYTIPEDKCFGFGLYPVKMVVRGDHTTVDFFLTVVPPKTETVVFSIDGSFTASMSVSGRDPKVRAGAVDVVRYWQELGYLIIYVTGRPDMQQRRVVAWLAQHNFPHGLVSFAEGLSTGPLKHKTDYLKQLQQEADIVFHAAYGSSKDVGVYSALDMPPEKIFIVGKLGKKLQSQATSLSEGYAQHLADLRLPGATRPAQGNARMVLSRGCFGLPGLPKKRRSAKRTASYPLPPRSPNAAAASASVHTPSHKLNV